MPYFGDGVLKCTPACKTSGGLAVGACHVRHTKSYFEKENIWTFDSKVTVPFQRFLGYDWGEDGNLIINEEIADLSNIFDRFIEEGVASESRKYWERIKKKGDSPPAA